MVYWLALLGTGGIAALLVWRKRAIRNADARRGPLLAALKRYRYFKMLKYLHVDVDRYVDVVQEDTLTIHLNRCAACASAIACDECLRDGRRVYDLHFCPNYDELIAESRLMSQR